jgi:HEPN domain-containing protein
MFHCQQAAEKAMKGFLTAHDRLFRKTHDLDELAAACEAVDPTLKDVLYPARDLTVFAWEFRYPGDAVAPALEEARQFRAVAGEVYQAILARLPQATHPRAL